MCQKKKSATARRRPLVELTADERKAMVRQKLEVQIAGVVYDILQYVVEHDVPKAAEPMRRAAAAALTERHPAPYCEHLRELADQIELWEFNDGDHSFEDINAHPAEPSVLYPANVILPKLMSKQNLAVCPLCGGDGREQVCSETAGGRVVVAWSCNDCLNTVSTAEAVLKRRRERAIPAEEKGKAKAKPVFVPEPIEERMSPTGPSRN